MDESGMSRGQSGTRGGRHERICDRAGVAKGNGDFHNLRLAATRVQLGTVRNATRFSLTVTSCNPHSLRLTAGR